MASTAPNPGTDPPQPVTFVEPDGTYTVNKTLNLFPIVQNNERSWAVFKNGSFFGFAAIIAYMISVFAVFFAVVWHAVGNSVPSSNCSNTRKDEFPATISASIASGWLQQDILGISMPLYAVFRSTQILGEYWFNSNEQVLFVPRNEILSAELSRIVGITRLFHSMDNAITPTLVLIFDVVAQFFLIGLVTVTVYDANDMHVGSTCAFVVFYIIYAGMDTCMHWSLRHSNSWHVIAVYCRLGLTLLIATVGVVFLVVYLSEWQVLVALSEYLLAFSILSHSCVGAIYVWDARLRILSVPSFVVNPERYAALEKRFKTYSKENNQPYVPLGLPPTMTMQSGMQQHPPQKPIAIPSHATLYPHQDMHRHLQQHVYQQQQQQQQQTKKASNGSQWM